MSKPLSWKKHIIHCPNAAQWTYAQTIPQAVVRYCTSALVSDPDPYPWVNYEHKLILRSLQVVESPRLGAVSQVPADKQVLVSN
jgi:hypothetical protein